MLQKIKNHSKRIKLLKPLLIALLLFTSFSLLTQSNTAYAAKCLENEGSRTPNDCSGYDPTTFPDGQIDPNGCYYITHFRSIDTGQITSTQVQPGNCESTFFGGSSNIPATGGSNNSDGSDSGGTAQNGSFSLGDPEIEGNGGNQCGGGEGNETVTIALNIGCRGQGNPIVDMLFAIIRFLSVGVGLVIIGSIIVAGIQYTTSQGDPNATAKALGRISSAATALLIYIFAAALLNFVIPAGIFN